MAVFTKRPGFGREEDVGPQPATFFTSGAISNINESVVLYAPGASSATVAIRGTFNGSMRAVGSGTEAADTKGGRLLFQSGVGSVGRNTISGNFTNYNKEFRIVAGGSYIIVEPTAWTSGTATVEIYATQTPSLIFINGPVHNADEEATRDERAYLATSGVVDVTASNALGVALKNPSNSGVNIFLERRLFSNNRTGTQTALEYEAIGNPTAILANSGNGINRCVGAANSLATFDYEVDTVANLGTLGGFLGSGEVLPRGVPYTRDVLVKLPPGTGFGVIITGAGNNLANAARVGVTLEWFEEAI